MKAWHAGALALALMASGPAAADALELDGFATQTTAQGSTVLIPEGKTRQQRPVLILLPFTGGTPRELLEWHYAESLPRQAARRGFIIVVPRARGSLEDYATGSAWSATLERYTRGVRADAEDVVARFDGDPARIVLAGYSMGGDLAWALPLRDPERYAGAIIMGSRATYRARGALERLAQRSVRLFTFMGKGETATRKAGMAAARAEIERAGISHHAAEGAGEHVPAPAKVFEEAVDFTLGYAAGLRSPPVAPRAPAPAEPSRPVSSEIVERLPGCDWEPFEAKGGQSGYKNARGKVVVAPRFDLAQAFGADGLAAIHENGRFGYLACSGKTFTVMALDNGPDPFVEGLARFEENGRIGYANRRGEAVIPARHESAQPFCRGLAAVGSDCSESQRGEHRILECERTQYIDRTGRVVPTPARPPQPPHCEVAQSQEIPERVAACGWKPFQDKSSQLYGYRDARGKVVVPARYDQAGPFGADGLAATRTGNFGVGYLSCEGQAFEVLYDGGADAFSDGLVRVEREGGAIGYVNRRGQVVVPADYAYGTPFCGGVAKVGKACAVERGSERLDIVDVDCQEWAYIDRQGRAVPASKVSRACAARVREPRRAEDEAEEEAGEAEEEEEDDEEDEDEDAE